MRDKGTSNRIEKSSFEMREHRIKGFDHMQSAVENAEKSLGPNSDAVSQQRSVAEPFSATTGILYHNVRDDKVPIITHSLAPYITCTTDGGDPTATPAFPTKDIDSWRRSVALRNEGTSTTSVASTVHHEPSSPQHTNTAFSIDMEKQSLHTSSRFSQHTQTNGLVERGGAVYTSYSEPLVDGCQAKDHTPWILVCRS